MCSLVEPVTMDMDTALAMKNMNWLTLYTKANDLMSGWLGRIYDACFSDDVDKFGYILDIGESMNLPSDLEFATEDDHFNFITLITMISAHFNVSWTRSEVKALEWMLKNGYELPVCDSLITALDNVMTE